MCELFMKNVIHIPVDKNVQRNVTLPVPSCSGIFENVRRVKWKDAFDAVHVRIMSLRIIHTCTQYIYFSPWSRDTRVQESKRQRFEPFRENGISSWRWISSSCCQLAGYLFIYFFLSFFLPSFLSSFLHSFFKHGTLSSLKIFTPLQYLGVWWSSAIINLFSEARYNDDNDATMTITISRYTVSTEWNC